MSQRLLPGQRPPVAVITPDDQGGAIFVTAGLGLAVCAVSIIVRVYVRAGYMNSVLGADDLVIGIAFLFLIVESAVLLKGASAGLGKNTNLLQASELETIQKMIYATDILYIITLWLTRFSSVLFFQRLSQKTRHEWASAVLFIGGAICAVSCLLAVALRCNLSHPWIFANQHCTGLFERWLAVTIIDIVYEIALFSVPLYIILGLQMSKRTKLKVLPAFGSRLLVIIPDLLHLLSLPSFYALTNGRRVSSYNESTPYLYKQIILCTAIVAATIPSLRPFMMATATSFGLVTGSGTGSYGDPTSAQRSKSGKMRNSIKLTPLVSLNSLKDNGESSSAPARAARWHTRSRDRQGYSATVFHAGEERDASIASDTADDRPIIRRDVQYSVSYADREADEQM